MATSRFTQMKLSEESDSYTMVAAIDFGTTFSAYAFSFKSQPEDIKMNKNWSESLGFQSYKAPTCVMTGPDDKFVAFGYEAENRYTEVSAETAGDKYHIYRQFKMELYKEKHINRDTVLTSAAGKPRKAMDIFAMASHYLKNHLVESVSRVSNFNAPDQIKWVITVPAIWPDEAKQFMREAAFQAGLVKRQDSKLLMIALEPEAASVYCRGLDIDHFMMGAEGAKSVSFATGTKYIVIDAGGGTVDITAHEVLASSQVKELHTANGGAWGGTKVDENFINLLKEVMGEKFIDVYMKECPRQWIALLTNYERVKKSVKADGTSKFVIPLSWSMGMKHKEVMGSGIEDVIRRARSTGVTFANGSLIINHEAIAELFKPVVKQIVDHVESLVKLPQLASVQYFMLVGGFGDCSFLHEAIKSRFHHICLLVPDDAQMSVIKGAVLFGHQPDVIKSRISRKTYGVDIFRAFKDGVHDPQRLVMKDNSRMCRDIFDPFIQVGEEVATGSVKSVKYKPAHANVTKMIITLYATEKKIPQNVDEYIDSKGMEKVGVFVVDMPDTKRGIKRSVQLDITFGGTEIEINATDATSGCTAEARIDFLTE